jgi:antitoxin ParD1/3/4
MRVLLDENIDRLLKGKIIWNEWLSSRPSVMFAHAQESCMTIAIRPELERKIADKVKSGRYASADDVVADALEALDRVEEAERMWKADIKGKVEEGWAQAERGEGIPADIAFARLRERIERWRRAKS